ncbi:MAG TPA: OmpA family protein, partial [Vicinamibacteria bacterium]|nr:OmpA family protein [Vicinamibacteria bacterium]
MALRASRRWVAGVIALGVTAGGCASNTKQASTPAPPRATAHDKTAKGAGVGAAAGAATAVLMGKRQADQILIGAAIGAAAGAGVGAYMDAQEEKLARIPGTSVERIDKDTLLVRFDSDILFGTNSASLGPVARGSLQEVATVLSNYNKTAVVVQGHTDSAGPSTYNQELSERRARSVSDALVDYGVAPARLVASGYGETLPVATNSSERGRQLNRRVTLLLKAKAT